MSWWRRRAPTDARRWVVLDVEASGLDAARDRLLAIAAVAVVRHADDAPPRIAPGDSFEVVLRHEAAPVARANILVHGIGVGAQREGVDAADALARFESWAGASPLIAFHAAFDETLIQRSMRAALGRRLPNRWLDLAPLAQVLRPDLKARSLDEWMDALGVRCARRHQASTDALATAELLLKLWPALHTHTARSDFRALARLAAQRRWLPP